MKKYDIATYIWPAYSGDDMRSRIFWEEGIGEWQTVKNSSPKANGYHWNRKPIWGYLNEADPKVMEMQIETALDYGVNVFIYDWYWYDGRPFLENCLKNGFLKASNCRDMKFYILWANHDVNYTWDKRNAGKIDATLWKGAVDRNQFEKIAELWLKDYFVKENYYKIDEKPVVSIYEFANFVIGLGGYEKATEAMKWFDSKAKNAGFNGVHFQFIRWDGKKENISGVDGQILETSSDIMKKMGFSSLTHYQFVHFAEMKRDYNEIIPDVVKEYNKISDEYVIPYFPHVSVGWDNNPRFIDFKPRICQNNTPQNFEKALRAAKEHADKTGVSLITINSWNEWTETSYLLPDNVNGFGYLEAIKKVFK